MFVGNVSNYRRKSVWKAWWNANKKYIANILKEIQRFKENEQRKIQGNEKYFEGIRSYYNIKTY